MGIRELQRRLMRPEGGDDGSGAGGGGDGGGSGAPGAGDGAGAGDGGGGAAGAGDDKGAGDAAGKSASLMESLGKGAAGGAADAGDDKGKGDDKALTDDQKALAAAEKDTRRPASVPAKFWDAGKGEVKFDAWAKSTTELETRMRTTGLPPKEAGEYKFEVPKAMKELGVDLEPAQSKAFRDAAHGLGLTQKQYEGVMGLYFDHMKGLADQTSQFSEQSARTELLAYYKNEEAMTENVRAAYQTFMAYADENDQALINQIGNIPAVVRILAKVNRDMGEDSGVAPDAILDGDSLETLMRGGPGKDDAPYWNATDPRHKSTVAKVKAHHEAQAAARRRKAG